VISLREGGGFESLGNSLGKKGTRNQREGGGELQRCNCGGKGMGSSQLKRKKYTMEITGKKKKRRKRWGK